MGTKSTIIILMSLLLPNSIIAVNKFGQGADSVVNNFTFEVTSDIVSPYVWRGMALSNSPAIQPGLSLAVADFTFGASTFSLNYYFNPTQPIASNDYFEWKAMETKRSLETILFFEGLESFPVTYRAAIYIYGNDCKDDGENYYSTYLEFSYLHELKDYSIIPFIGITLREGMYSKKINIVNIGVTGINKIILGTDFKLAVIV